MLDLTAFQGVTLQTRKARGLKLSHGHEAATVPTCYITDPKSKGTETGECLRPTFSRVRVTLQTRKARGLKHDE